VLLQEVHSVTAQPLIGPTTVLLDGSRWLLAVDPQNVGVNQQWWAAPQIGAVNTKIPWIIQDAFLGYHGVAWYWHTFDAPANPHASGKYLLRFWSVSYKATVWVNGSMIGTHEGADTPFVLDATTVIKPGQSNLVAVRVVDPTQAGIDGLIRSQIPGGNVFSHAGIEDSVELLICPAVYLTDFYVKPDPTTGVITIQANARNTLATAISGHLQFSVTPTDANCPMERELPPGDTLIQTQLQINNPHLWDINAPFLYQVTARLWQPIGCILRNFTKYI
jgi:beta-galactosidase/beta-glucuronidase